MRKARCHLAFGLHVASVFAIPGLRPEGAGVPDLTTTLAPQREVDASFSGGHVPVARTETALEGNRFTTERGVAGDLRFDYGPGGSAHWSPESSRLTCSAEYAEDPAWLRVLLDSVLGTLALSCGFEALHASAVSFPHGAVAIMAASGGGKTSLALELVARGHPLFADDIVALDRRDGSVRAHPSPPVANVPLRGAVEPTAVGEVLATFAHEAWVAVKRDPPEPTALAALFVLDRAPGHQLRALAVSPPNPLPLLQHGLRSGADPARMRARFELLADVAAAVPVFRLEADPAVPAAELAEVVESSVVTGALA